MPSYGIDLGGGFGFSISPAIAFGSNGFSLGANLGLGYSSYNFSLAIRLNIFTGDSYEEISRTEESLVAGHPKYGLKKGIKICIV